MNQVKSKEGEPLNHDCRKMSPHIGGRDMDNPSDHLLEDIFTFILPQGTLD